MECLVLAFREDPEVGLTIHGLWAQRGGRQDDLHALQAGSVGFEALLIQWVLHFNLDQRVLLVDGEHRGRAGGHTGGDGAADGNRNRGGNRDGAD